VVFHASKRMGAGARLLGNAKIRSRRWPCRQKKSATVAIGQNGRFERPVTVAKQ
jgi:hypothetical protein